MSKPQRGMLAVFAEQQREPVQAEPQAARTAWWRAVDSETNEPAEQSHHLSHGSSDQTLLQPTPPAPNGDVAAANLAIQALPAMPSGIGNAHAAALQTGEQLVHRVAPARTRPPNSPVLPASTLAPSASPDVLTVRLSMLGWCTLAAAVIVLIGGAGFVAGHVVGSRGNLPPVPNNIPPESRSQQAQAGNIWRIVVHAGLSEQALADQLVEVFAQTGSFAVVSQAFDSAQGRRWRVVSELGWNEQQARQELDTRRLQIEQVFRRIDPRGQKLLARPYVTRF